MADMQDPHDTNLIPPARLQTRRLKGRLRLWLGVCGVYGLLIAVALACAYAGWGGDDSAARQQVQSASHRNQDITTSIIAARGRLASAATALQAARAIEDQPDWSRLLGLLAENLGEDIVLNGCGLVALDEHQAELGAPLDSLQAKAVASLAFGPRRHCLHLTGFGRNRHAISEFTVRLERTGLFAAVRCLHSDRQPFLEGEAMAFAVDCEL